MLPLVLVEPSSSCLNKMPHPSSLKSVVLSDNSEWNIFHGFVPNIEQNFQEEGENYDPAMRTSREALSGRAFVYSTVYPRVQ